MTQSITISLDAMGGDDGVDVVLGGAEIALKRQPDTRFLLFGKEDLITAGLNAHPALAAASEVRHCDISVEMDVKPSLALRQGRYHSSMWRAIQAVKDGEASPAIAAIWPTLRGDSIVLDVGATIGADAEQLVIFSVMGGAMARALFSIQRPTVGLLNVGVEEIKGVEEVRKAGQILREADLPFINYIGFVEGNDLGKGTSDVVVTEGFAGNIALKAAEGTARQIAQYLRAAMEQSLMTKIGYFFAKGAFKRLREKMDPSKSNGGVFLGLNGLVIKSHGSASHEGFASAIGMGDAMARNNLLKKLSDDLEQFRNVLKNEPKSKD